MIVLRKYLPRRTVLRGIGASVALPWLDAMVPALRPARLTAAAPVKRLGVVYVPNGMSMQYWTPPSEGALEITPILRPLAPVRDQLIVVSGLPSRMAEANDSAPHQRAQATWPTGCKAKKGEATAELGISMDQIVAQELGHETQLASLELGIEPNDVLGACVSGYHCAYNNTIAWRDATTPLPMENNPRAVFERLFGASDSTDRRTRLELTRRNRSVIDDVLDKVHTLERRVGVSDRRQLDQYLNALREVEHRLQRAEEQGDVDLPELTVPTGIPSSFEEHTRLMFDLQVLAWQVDITRVTTYLMGREISNRAYPEIGVRTAHHPLSHHQGDPDMLARLAKVNTLHMQAFSHFVERLRSTPDGEGSLLDHALLLYGAGMSESNGHVLENLPTLLVAGTAFGIKGGRHLRYPDTPFTNLQLTILERMGVVVERFGDSNGELNLLSGV